MSSWNLQEASLLDASGELTPAAHKLLARISGDSDAQNTFQQAHENLTLLSALPIPEPSAAERRFIPTAIKKALHLTLNQHEKQAVARNRLPLVLFRWASAGLALAACVAACVMLARAQHFHEEYLRDQTDRINANIDRIAGMSMPFPSTARYPDQADIPSDALNSLAALPFDDQPSATDTEDADYSGPPGSY